MEGLQPCSADSLGKLNTKTQHWLLQWNLKRNLAMALAHSAMGQSVACTTGLVRSFRVGSSTILAKFHHPCGNSIFRPVEQGFSLALLAWEYYDMQHQVNTTFYCSNKGLSAPLRHKLSRLGPHGTMAPCPRTDLYCKGTPYPLFCCRNGHPVLIKLSKIIQREMTWIQDVI